MTHRAIEQSREKAGRGGEAAEKFFRAVFAMHILCSKHKPIRVTAADVNGRELSSVSSFVKSAFSVASEDEKRYMPKRVTRDLLRCPQCPHLLTADV